MTSKTIAQPVSRLVCFGGARRHTNAPPGIVTPELEPPDRFD